MKEQKEKSFRPLINKIILCVILSLIIIFLTQETIFKFAPLKRIELATLDARFNSRGAISFEPKVVIVEISEESFKSVPHPWPWPRDYYAKLVRNLKEAGARAIGVDLIFTDEDAKNPDKDSEFRKAIKETGIITLAGKVTIADERYDLITSKSNYGNVFFDVDSSIGIVYLRNDEDGVHRRFHPIVFDRALKRRLPTFSVAVINKFLSRSPLKTVEIDNDYFTLENFKIPNYDGYTALINYYGPPGTYKPIKFVDVIDDKDFQTIEEKELGTEINTFDDPETGYLNDGTFKDKIVLIGSTNPEDKDLFPVPIAFGKQEGDNLMYGVEIHANIIQNILDSNFLRPEPKWLELSLILLFVTLTFFFTLNLKLVKVKFHYFIEALAIAVVFAELFLIIVISFILFNHQNYVTSITGPIMGVIFGYTGSMVFSYVSERKQKVLIKSMFSQYVNPTIVNQLIEDPQKLQLGGERKELSVFFTDLEKFTTIAEKMPPEKLVPILNEFFVEMTEIILKNNGTLDKYQGDSIMAFFGAPIPDPNHALNACRAAVHMQNHLEDIRRDWNKENKPSFHMRIGINTGPMIVGNIGGLERFDYTVIGDSVNLGSRLEGANKQYQTKIIISENTYKKVASQVITRELDLITVVGKNQPLKIYELFGIVESKNSTDKLRLIELFTKGLVQYRRRDWKKAIECFEEVLKYFPNDYPSKIYIERSETFIQSPPPDDWDGVFAIRTK